MSVCATVLAHELYLLPKALTDTLFVQLSWGQLGLNLKMSEKSILCPSKCGLKQLPTLAPMDLNVSDIKQTRDQGYK